MTLLSKINCTVLGAGGFLGTNLCLRLKSLGANVIAYGRPSNLLAAFAEFSVTPSELDDQASLMRAVEGADVVFDVLGGTTPASSNANIMGDLESNVTRKLRLLEACRIAKVKKLVFPSSGGTVYGRVDIVPTPETATTNPICAYGIGKLAVEKYLHLYQYLHELDYVVLRISNPYGRYQYNKRGQGVIGAFLARASYGEPVEIWGDGSVVRDYVHVSDVVEAFVKAAHHQGSTRVFNIGSGVGHSVVDIVTEIEQILGRPVARIYRQGRPVDVPVSILNIACAERELAWRPLVGLRDGLTDTFGWMLANGVADPIGDRRSR